MPSKTFEGKDKYDLDTQIWNWKSENPKIKELKRYPVETLPISMNKVTPGGLEIGKNHPVFPGRSLRKPISHGSMRAVLHSIDDQVTVHGFRSAFRIAADKTDFPLGVGRAQCGIYS